MKSLKSRAYFLAGLAALLVATASGRPAMAFSIKPGAMVLHAKPGKTVEAVYEVGNDTDTVLKLLSQVRDSNVLPENKDIHAQAWIEPQFKELILPPNSSKKAVFKVHVPKDAKGELSALISFVLEVMDSTAPAKGDVVQKRIIPVITASCYVWVKGTERGEAALGPVHVLNRPSTLQEPAQVAATVVVKNSGNIHQRPSGTFEIFNRIGAAPMMSLQFPSGWPVMPYSDYTYEARTPGTLGPGDYLMHAKVVFSRDTVIERNSAFTMDLTGNATNYRNLP
jgi:hypothetical protein